MKHTTIGAAVALAIAAAAMQCSTVSAQDAQPSRRRPEVLLPRDSDSLAWRYDMKLGDWSGGCSGYVYELNSPDLIQRRVDDMKAEGFNAIIMSGFHMHNNFLRRWPRITRHVKNVCAAAHGNGMRVVFHHDVPVVSYHGQGLQEMVKHLDWLARDVDHDRPTLRHYCIVNPGFRQTYFDRMTAFVRETGVDGVMLDEANFGGIDFCGCRHCRREFTRCTGLVLPRRNTSKVFRDKWNPMWAAWLNWRKQAVGDWWVEMRKAFNSVNPDLCIMIYTTHYGFSSHYAPMGLGADITQYARACDFLGTEIMARNVYDCYRAVFAFRKAKAMLGDHFGIPIWGLVYHVDDPNFAYMGWAMNHINRQTSWISSIEGEDMRRYLDWPDRMQSRFAEPVSDVAILFSSSARDFGRMMGSVPDALGVSQLLTDAHVQHDFIMEDDLLDAAKLGRYRILVLASAGNMSAAQANAVRSYVESGGALLATGHTSLLTPVGQMLPNFRLADVLGVDYVKRSVLRGPREIRLRGDDKTLTVPVGILRLNARKGARVLADVILQGKPTYPALVATECGKGRCLYLPFQLGALNYEREYRGNQKSTYEKNVPMAQLLIRLVRDLAAGPLRFEPVAIPEKVIAAVCRQTVDGNSALLVHLLNATGAGMAKGEMIAYKREWPKQGAFPAIGQDIVFSIHAPGVTAGYIASPDYQERRPVSVAQRSDGRVRVTVKEADLKAYSIVYLPTKGPVR